MFELSEKTSDLKKIQKISEKHLTKSERWVIIYYENKADTVCGSPFDPIQSNAETVNMLFSEADASVQRGMMCGECRHVSALIFVLNFNAWGCPQ